MNRTRSLAAIGLVGAAVLAGCNDGVKKDIATLKQDVQQLKQDVKELQGEREALRKYLDSLGTSTVSVHKWLQELAVSLCEVEKRTPGLDPAKRICRTGPGDIKSVPTYPPR